MNSEAPVRAFVAVEVSDEVRSGLADLQLRLQALLRGVRWVAPANLHITMVFLGEVGQVVVSGVEAGMRNALERVRPFDVQIAGVGCFGSRRSPRIVWAGIRQGAEPLSRIADTLRNDLRGRGFVLDDKPFRPHVTLGRARRTGAGDASAALDEVGDYPVGVFQVRRLALMRSQLDSAGPVYTPLAYADIKVAESKGPTQVSPEG